MDLSDNPLQYPSDMRIREYDAYELTSGWEPAGEGFTLGTPSPPTKERSSCRAYSDKPLSLDLLSSLLHRMCARPPSAGGLNPIRLSVVLNKAVGELPEGLYHYHSPTHSLITAEGDASPEELRYALNREDCVHNAPAVIVISGDMHRQTEKYANRGWRYTLIEAGIAAERLVDGATERGLGSLVFGGYDDYAMSRLLFGDSTPQVRTIVTVAVGHSSINAQPDVDLESLHYELDHLFVGEGKLVEGAGTTNQSRRPGDLSFHQVLATLRAANGYANSLADDRTCGGTGASIVAARTKAIVECVERHSSGNLRIDRTGPATEVNPSFDIAAFVPLTANQIDACAYLDHYRPDRVLEWSEAQDLHSGAKEYLPVDLIYYPLSTRILGRPLLQAANSSGIATHTDPAEATSRALLELIERHSVLASWHNQQPPTIVPDHVLPKYAINRRRYWRQLGYELYIFDYMAEGVPVVGVAIGSSEQFPAFSFGSAASTMWHGAVVKALHEAEVGIAGYRSLAVTGSGTGQW
ncbi:YcaO-like family protein [Rhodococcus sp. IEGM 1370]|nr:YcaO-like family protein [Rhodococcus sp. IEGM 1370]MDV8079640.1 YcaO-like family protein [Rhodococcus sp. IEGM 1370]